MLRTEDIEIFTICLYLKTFECFSKCLENWNEEVGLWGLGAGAGVGVGGIWRVWGWGGFGEAWRGFGYMAMGGLVPFSTFLYKDD